MKSMIGQATLREIKQSLGRYLAIMAIVALGVGLFAGLKVTRTQLLVTVQEYLEENQFYDYRLLSTLGFEEEDVDFFSGQEGVRTAEGAVSFDIVYVNEAGNDSVLKAHSLTGSVNNAVLKAGRMPENADECVVDSNLFTEDQIGSKIIFSESNAAEDLEHFVYREYTIVGIVQSPIYIQFERGNTSLGNGKVAGFIYLLPEGFEAEYYTEIYVKFTDDFDIYSDAYTDFLDAKETVWEDLTQGRAMKRYEDILAEAEEEIADAEQKLADKVADAEKELADAKQELDDGKQELDDAYAELTDGEKQIADAEKELADGEKELAEKEQELKDAEAELAKAEAELPEKEQELKDAETQYNEANYSIEQKKVELRNQENELRTQQEQAEAGMAVLDAAEQQIDEQETQLNAAIAAGIVSETDPAVVQARAEIAAGRQQITEQRATVQAGLDTIQAYLNQVEMGWNAIRDGDKQLAEVLDKIHEGKQQLAEGKQEIADAKAEIADGWVQIADAKKEMKDGRAELEEKKQELSDGWTDYEDGLKEYEDGLKEYEDGVAELNTEVADAKKEIADARAELAEIEKPSSYVLGRNTNVGYVCFENDSSIVAGIADIFPVFFFLVAALVCMTTMNRMVEEQRTQIGVLKALGYSDRVIMNKYLFYSGSAALSGCIVGFAFGTWFFPKVIWYAYGIMYSVAPLKYVFSWEMALFSLAFSMLCSVGTTWFSCRYELAEVAAQLMRPKAPKAGKRVLLERIPFIWKRLKFLHKVSVRNIFRYKKRFFMMIVGISGCTALLVTGFGVKDSVTSVAQQQFTQIHIYDIDAVFQNPIGEDVEREFCEITSETVENWTCAAELAMDLHAGEQIKGLNMIIMESPEDMDGFINLYDSKGTPIAYPGKGEIVINRKIADNFHLSVGDELHLQDEEMRPFTVKVSGICENFVYNYAYISGETYLEQSGKAPEYKSIFINLKQEADPHQVSADIMGMKDISSVTVNEDMLERFDSMMGSIDIIVLVIVLCAAMLAFIVLYNLTNINITERVREIATIKVLGFYKKETSSYVFRENTVLTLVGALVGLVLGYFMHQFVMSKVVVDIVYFDVHIEPVSYLYSLILTLVFGWLINRMMTGKLERINMAESLKSVD